VSISGKGRAKTFAVAAHVTAACIQDAPADSVEISSKHQFITADTGHFGWHPHGVPVDVIGHGHLRVAFFKQIRFEKVAVSDCPHFAVRMSGAGVLQWMIGQLENG